MRGEYLLLLTVSLLSVVVLDRVGNLGVFRQWRRLLIVLIPVEVAILAWDFLGVARWNWSSNHAVLAGPYAFGGRIPLEELLFPVIVAACGLTLWELVKQRTGSNQR